MKNFGFSPANLFFVASAFSAPEISGNVVLKNEMVIINDKIVCSAYSAPAEDIRPETISNIVVNDAVVSNEYFTVGATVAGENLTIHGSPRVGIILTLSEGKPKDEKKPAYIFTSYGKQEAKMSVLMKGKHFSAECRPR